MSGVTIATTLPATGFVCPTDGELRTLIKMVLGAHADLRSYAEATPDFERQFGRSFVACGYMFRRAGPVTDRYFHAIVEDGNELLQQYWRAPPVSGAAFLAAVIAHGDIAWRPAQRSVGQLLEVGLNPDSGLRCANAWRDILKGRPLRSPLAPRRFLVEQAEPSPVTFYQQRAGEFHPVPIDGLDMWRR